MSAPTLRLDDLTIDLARRRVERDGVPLDVGGLSFDLFAYLLAQGDRVVGFDELIAGVWAPAVVGEETVTQRVKLLRQSLGDDGRNPRYVRSVRGKGYQLCGSPRPVDDMPAPDALPDAPPLPPARSRPRRAFALAAAAGVVIAAAGVMVWTNMQRPGAQAPAAAPTERDELLQRARYYGGIWQKDNIDRAVELYDELLRRDPDDHAAQVGLSFAYSARVCLLNQEPQWIERAQQLARAALAANPRDSLAEAALGYSHDCRGELRDAIVHYERAVALDPAARTDSAASLAYIYMVQGRLADALEANIAVERSGAKPRHLDIQIARVLELLGYAAAAEKRYQRSFRLYPDNTYSNAAWPRFLFLQGRYGEAEAALGEALRRSQHPELYLLQGELALLRGERDAASAAFAQASALRPHASLPLTLTRLHGTQPPDPAWIAQRIAGLSGYIATGAGGWPEDQIEIALLELARGDKPAAIAALRGAIAAGFLDRAYLQTSALFRPLADEPAFAALIETIAGRVNAERTRAAPLAAAEP
jgi:DNA-binding winged helix-turn-helix (wHTH) protein/tetratricopeptide (TPR) repeat protein